MCGMDCIGFVKSMKYNDDFEPTVKTFFDEIMALYNLVGSSSPLNICNEVIDPSCIKFTLLANSEKDAKIMYNLIQNRVLNIYGRVFEIEISLADKTLTIFLKDRPSG